LTLVEEFFQEHFTILAIVGIGVASLQVSYIESPSRKKDGNWYIDP